MALVRKRGSSYQIRVSCGLRVDGSQVIQTRTWKPDPNLTERQVEKELAERHAESLANDETESVK